MCVAADNCKLQERVEAMDGRLGKVEVRIDKLEGALNSGFTQVNTAIQQLATDFSTRMNTLDQSIVEEKAKENERKHAERVKWGEVKRNITVWAARLIMLGCASAMGLTAYKMIFGGK